MEWKSLIAGLVFTMGIYAVKCGIGLSCGLGQQETKARQFAFTAGAALAYTLLFGGSYLLLTRVNLLNQLLIVQKMAEWAMAVHLVMATLLIAWGISLMKRSEDVNGPGRGWWLFAMPCPVCMGVILLTVAFVIGFFPETSLEMTAVAWGVFVTLGTLSFFISRRLGDRFEQPHHFLGTMMVLAALWFILSVLVVPHVSELPDIFNLASNRTAISGAGGDVLPWVIVSMVLLFAGGVLMDRLLNANHESA